MIPAYVVALFAHFVADFPVQSALHRWMGQKATKLSHLLNHTAAYTIAFFLVFIAINRDYGWFRQEADYMLTFKWVFLNAVLHGVIDLWTSKGTNWLWPRAVYSVVEPSGDNAVITHVSVDQRYAGPFFSLIGLDQFVHVSVLMWSGFAMGVF